MAENKTVCTIQAEWIKLLWSFTGYSGQHRINEMEKCVHCTIIWYIRQNFNSVYGRESQPRHFRAESASSCSRKPSVTVVLALTGSGMRPHISVELPDIKFHENPSSVLELLGLQTDRQCRANRSIFPYFSHESAYMESRKYLFSKR